MLIKTVAMLLLMILLPANAQSSSERQCRLRTLEGIDAQEMMVKGVIMHTEFQEDPKDTAGQNEITFIHTLRADWTIWICIQSLLVHEGNPRSLQLVCTGCDYD